MQTMLPPQERLQQKPGERDPRFALLTPADIRVIVYERMGALRQDNPGAMFFPADRSYQVSTIARFPEGSDYIDISSNDSRTDGQVETSRLRLEIPRILRVFGVKDEPSEAYGERVKNDFQERYIHKTNDQSVTVVFTQRFRIKDDGTREKIEDTIEARRKRSTAEMIAEDYSRPYNPHQPQEN